MTKLFSLAINCVYVLIPVDIFNVILMVGYSEQEGHQPSNIEGRKTWDLNWTFAFDKSTQGSGGDIKLSNNSIPQLWEICTYIPCLCILYMYT